MRMVRATYESTTEGTLEVQQTGVGGDAKIVYALLTGMVTDKVAYPVREYATNAWEVSPAGKPAEIELPTRFNPQYSIRDFGPGLGHKFMMKKYAKIGESTKDQDDDAVGGWGFGSKAALAYLMRTDGAGSFTVISRHRGFRRIYSIGVSPEGKIQITFMGEWVLDETDRGTGLEVTFPVRPEDIDRFHDNARAILWSFEPRPVVTPKLDFGNPRTLAKGDGWTLYSSESVPWSGPQVRLGPVMYPIDLSLAPSGALFDYSTHIVFDAKIGTISVSASRETLQYNDTTAQGLAAIFAAHRENYVHAAQVEVDACDNWFSASLHAWRLADQVRRFGLDLTGKLNWRGHGFRSWLFGHTDPAWACLWPDCKPKHAHQAAGFRTAREVHPGQIGERRIVIETRNSRSIEKLYAVGLQDTPVLWVRTRKEHLAWTLERLGNPDDVIMLDDVKLPPREKTARGAPTVKMRRVVDHTGEIVMTAVDLAGPVVFIEQDGRGKHLSWDTNYQGSHRNFGASKLRRRLATLRKGGVIDEDFVLLIKRPTDTVGPTWQEAGDFIAEGLEQMLDTSQLNTVIPWSESSFPRKLTKLIDFKIDLGVAPSDLRDLIHDTKALIHQHDKLTFTPNEHDELATWLIEITKVDIKSVAPDPTVAVNNRWEAILAKYPLLEMVIEDLPSWERYLEPKHQRAFDHYFSLIAK